MCAWVEYSFVVNILQKKRMITFVYALHRYFMILWLTAYEKIEGKNTTDSQRKTLENYDWKNVLIKCQNVTFMKIVDFPAILMAFSCYSYSSPPLEVHKHIKCIKSMCPIKFTLWITRIFFKSIYFVAFGVASYDWCGYFYFYIILVVQLMCVYWHEYAF